MKNALLLSCALAPLLVFAACGGSKKDSAAPVASASVDTVDKPKEPTPEEKAKAEEARQLKEDRAKWDEDNKAEDARWTPELHKDAKALADKTFPNAKAALTAISAGKHRKPGNADRDKFRHPVETMEFFGLTPSMTVVDIGPGDGWYSELLAPTLAKKGKYIGTSNDPNGPADARPTFYAQRWAAFLAKSPELYGKVQTVVIADPKAPKLDMDGKVDMVIIMRGVHGMKNNGNFEAWLAEIVKALKPGGVLGIEDGRTAVGHAASLGDNWLKHEGVATAFALAEGRSFSFRHVIGAVPFTDAEAPRDIESAHDRMRILTAGGAAQVVPFDGEFLRIGRSVPV